MFFNSSVWKWGNGKLLHKNVMSVGGKFEFFCSSELPKMWKPNKELLRSTFQKSFKTEKNGKVTRMVSLEVEFRARINLI